MAAAESAAGKAAPARTGDKIRVLPLGEIDSLIEAREFNAALEALSVYMQAYPRDFDRAQERVRRVMMGRLEYDSKAEQLVDTMRNDNDNDDRKMDLIIDLEKSERNQTKTAVDLTRQARKTLATRFFIDRYNKIMSAGYKLVQSEDYAEAVAKFQEGFTLKGSDTDKVFDGTSADGIPVEYDEDITVPADEAMARISALLPDFGRLCADCQSAYEAFMAAVGAGDPKGARAAEARVRTAFGALASFRNSVMEQVRVLRGIDEVANGRNPLLAGFSYITFTLGFVEGDEQVIDTGVLGSLDAFWNRRVESMKGAVYSLVHGRMKAAEDALPLTKIREMAEESRRLAEEARTAADFCPVGRGVQSLYSLVEREDGTRVGDGFTEYGRSMDFAERFAASLAGAMESSAYLADATLRRRTETIEDGRFVAGEEFLDQHLQAAETFEAIAAKSKSEGYVREELIREESYFEVQEILADVESGKADGYNQMELADIINERKKRRKTAGVQLEDAVLDFRDVIGWQETLARMNLAESDSSSRLLWKSLAVLFAVNAEEAAESGEVRMNRAATLSAGVEAPGKDGEKETRRYPAQARELADSVSEESARQAERFARLREALRAGEKYRHAFPGFDGDLKTLEASVEKLRSLSAGAGRISEEAARQVRLAARASEEAEAAFSRAEAALLRQDFAGARGALSQSSRKFADSFSIQEDAERRADADSRISGLAARIVREENELVVRDVRRLMDDAQESYYNGKLDAAEGLLVQARERWSETNAETNVEIEGLLEMVTTARTLQIGRRLKSADPLFPEMSQLLSAANQHYASGERLMAEGRRKEAAAELERARDKLEPMKLVYPLNEDAALLRLKIEKVLDPEAFSAGFKDRVAEARAKRGTAERLAALRDLLAISPDHPGLAKEIEELEYATGIRQRKVVAVDDGQERRAAEIYAEAERLFAAAGGDQAKLLAASARLDEIISMYSRNRRADVFRKATALKDRIQSRVGGTVVAALTADDEASFQKAQNAVNRGQLDAANDILDKLWQNPAAQKTKKIVDLRTFVKNRL